MTAVAARPAAETRAPAARQSGTALEEGSEAGEAAVGAVVAAVGAAGAAGAGAPESAGAEVSRAADE